MKSSSAGEGSKSLSGFFNRSVTLSDLQADLRVLATELPQHFWSACDALAAS